ncbi:MAG: peptidylprolyl isomerase, partial [Bacteroidota bacterium]
MLTDLAFGERSANPVYVISVMQEQTPLGDITIELFPDKAPLHCKNFDSLVVLKFYDGTAFHRIDPDFMIQG